MKYQLKPGAKLKAGITLKDVPPTKPQKVYPVKTKHYATVAKKKKTKLA